MSTIAAITAPRPRFETRQRIRFDQCDPAGIVFYPQYFILFNRLVEDWVTDGLGISYADLLGPRRIGLPTVSLKTDFRAISRIGDEVTLGLTVDRLGGSSLSLALDVSTPKQLRVQAQLTLVCTSLDSHRPIAMPPDLRQAIEHFLLPA
jgi:4-hydroxybenzoyl-CoA thioesterase